VITKEVLMKSVEQAQAEMSAAIRACHWKAVNETYSAIMRMNFILSEEDDQIKYLGAKL